MMMAAFLPCAALAQGLPPLPPLPPLPGVAAPAPAANPTPVTEVAPAPATTATAEIAPPPAPMEGGDIFAAPDSSAAIETPDFGLFDPAALPAPGGAAAGSEVATIPEMPELPELPNFTREAMEKAVESMEAAEMPSPPAPSAPVVAPAEPKQQVAEKKEEKPDALAEAPSSLADMAPPELPKDAPVDDALADALPSWVTDSTLPSLKPLPQDRPEKKVAENPKPAGKPKAPVEKAENKPDFSGTGEGPSLADMIDRQINTGDGYEEDIEGSYIGLPEDFAGGDGKHVVWPKNFKTQTLPPEIYHKQYSNANRHLPHAIYKKEIEAHLFGAVGANDADAVRALLRTGVPISVRNSMGDDLVMQAVKTGATTTLQLLLALGATPNNQDRYGATPLHRAVFAGRQDIATILLRAGANSYLADMNGVTPMSIAVARQDQPMMQTLGYYQASGYSNQRNMARYQPY